MPDYAKTKMYYIPIGDSLRYYGHTTATLGHRKGAHSQDFVKRPNAPLYKAMRDHGMSRGDIKLVHIEDWPCASFEEARTRERYHLESYPNTVNPRKPIRTKADVTLKNQQYYAREKSKENERNKAYYHANRERILERQKAWRGAHRANKNA